MLSLRTQLKNGHVVSSSSGADEELFFRVQSLCQSRFHKIQPCSCLYTGIGRFGARVELCMDLVCAEFWAVGGGGYVWRIVAGVVCTECRTLLQCNTSVGRSTSMLGRS